MPTLRNKTTGWTGSVTEAMAADRMRYPDQYEVLDGDVEPAAAAPGATPAGRDPGPSPGNPGYEGDYSAMRKAELESLASSRGLTVEGTGASGAVLVSDLVAALEASDA